MNREDILWLGIRLFGVYLAVKVVLVVPGTITTAVIVPKLLAMADASAVERFDTVAGLTQTQAILAPLTFVVYTAGAWYFLRGAPALSRFIRRHSGGSTP